MELVLQSLQIWCNHTKSLMRAILNQTSVFPSWLNIITLEEATFKHSVSLFFLLPSSADSFDFPLYLSSHCWCCSLSSSCFSSSHLILWINFSGVSLPWGWQALWLKGLLACCKWEAGCHFEVGGLLPAGGEPPHQREKGKGGQEIT